MVLARVKGTVVSTHKPSSMEGMKFLLLEKVDAVTLSGKGEFVVGIDGVGANVGWMIPFFFHLPAAFGLAGAGLVVLGAYGLARSIFGSNARALDRTLNDLADRLEAIARDATAGRSTPPG